MEVAISSMEKCLSLEGPLNDGPNVGTGLYLGGHAYRFEGVVKGERENGLGLVIWLSGTNKGSIDYGFYKNGRQYGSYVQRYFDGLTLYYEYEGDVYRDCSIYNETDPKQKAIIDKVSVFLVTDVWPCICWDLFGIVVRTHLL
eukprot:m.64054 g.64054  ORF g.64054 m.64054 type:complete len:143 (+) comp11621_c0_seq2:326-754(+)